MKYLPITVLFFFLVGCDSFPRASYSLGSFSEYRTGGKVEVLCKLLEEIALQHSLSKREQDRPETQCYFSESEMNSVVLGARKLNEQLVIDVQTFNHNKEFRAINAHIQQMLESKYGGRYLRVSG